MMRVIFEPVLSPAGNRVVGHTNDARKHGVSDEWMLLLDAWRKAPIYSARERAALTWTEAVTKVGKDHAPDKVYEQARRQFSEKELVGLTAAVMAINAWNRPQFPLPLMSVKNRNVDGGVKTVICHFIGDYFGAQTPSVL